MGSTKTILKRATAYALAFVMAFSMLFTGNNVVTTNAAAAVTKITVAKKSVSIEPGKKLKVKVTVKGGNKKFTAKSSNKKVATVKVVGKYVQITAKKKLNKTAKITVTTKGKNKKGKKLSAKITVKVENKTDNTAAQKTATDQAAATTAQTALNALPAATAVTTADEAKITEARKTYDALTPDQKALVPADVVKKLTDAEAALKAAKDAAAAQAASGITSVAFDSASYTIETGKSVQALVTVLPADAKDKTVTYTSTNTAVASVTNAGIIIAGSVGSATITATCGGKSATATVTVVAPNEIKLTPADGITLAIGESASISSSVDGVTWSSDKSNIATVSDKGLVTGVSAGKAVITATKAGVTASVEVNVTQYAAKTEGTTLSVYNPISNNDGTVLPNTCLVNQDLVIRAQVQSNQAGVKDARVKIDITPIDNHILTEYDYKIEYDNNGSYALTDDNGIAFITISPVNKSLPSTYDDFDECPYISFNVSSTVNGNKINDRDITIKFGSVLRNGIYVDNNNVRNVRSEAEDPENYGSDTLLSGDNHYADVEVNPINPWKEIPAVNQDDGIQQSYNTNDHYPVQYVSSQQVPGEVRLSATPYFILPPDRKASATDFQVTFNGKNFDVETGQDDVSVTGPVTTDTYTIYNDGADLTTTTSVINVPEGLVSMSVKFNKMDISKYSKMYVDFYECGEDGSIAGWVTGKDFAGEDWYLYKNEQSRAVQLEMSETKNKGVLIISIQSPGQVDVDTEGYTLTAVTGTFNAKKTMDPQRIEVVDSVKWTDVTEKATYTEPKEISYSEVIKYLEDYDSLPGTLVANDPNYKYYWSVPAFNSGTGANALTGNAIITARYTDGSRVEEVNYAYPCIRDNATWNGSKWEYKNVNKLMPQPAPKDTAGHIKAVMLGSDVVKDNQVNVRTGGLKQIGNQAVVKPGATENGILFAEAKIKVNALQEEITKAENSYNYDLSPLKGADDKYPLYTFVEYVPTPDAGDVLGTPPTFYSLEDQFVEISGLVKSSGGSLGTDQEVTFYDVNGTKITKSDEGHYYPIGASSGPIIKYLDLKTGKDGKARMILQATEGAIAEGIKVEYTANELYSVFETYAGSQKFDPILVAKNTKANVCNVEWIDLGLAYLDSVVPIDSKITGVWDYQYPSDGVISKESESVVAKNWKVGFLPAADSKYITSDYKALFALNRPTPPLVTNTFAEIDGVGVNYEFLDSNDPVDHANCSVVNAGVEDDEYETARITSTKTGTTKVTGKLRVDKEQCKINYYNAEGVYCNGPLGSENAAIYTVGVNKVTFDDTDYTWNPNFGGTIDYLMTWTPAEMLPSFVHPYGYGVATGQPSTFYFKAVDKYGNPIVGKKINIYATKDGSNYTGFSTPDGLKTDANGLVTITVPAQTACAQTYTVKDENDKLILADQDIIFKDVPTGVGALKIEGDPVVKESSQNAVTITFNEKNDIDLSSIPTDMQSNVLNELFVVKDQDGKEITISSVKVNKYVVQITTEKKFTANAKYTIEIKDTGVTKKGVTYVLRDVNGQAILPANNSKTFIVTIDQ